MKFEIRFKVWAKNMKFGDEIGIEIWTKLVDWCLTVFSAQMGYVVRQGYEIYCVGWGQDKRTVKQ